MPTTSTPPEPGGTGSPPKGEAQGDWREHLTFIADISQKLAIPLLTVVATGLGIYLSYSAQQRASESQEVERSIAAEQNRLLLKNQREQSETSLRATMFRELASPLLQDGPSGTEQPEQAAQRLALLAELLTLNFHEHFELGPALRYVDKLPGQTQDARLRLRSTARRVISRQLAPMITSFGANSESGYPAYVEISLTSVAAGAPSGATKGQSSPTPTALPACSPVGVPDPRSGHVKMNCGDRIASTDGAQLSTVPLALTSPDGRDRIMIAISSFDWSDQSIAVVATPLPPEGGAAAPAATSFPPQRIEFTVSSYSLPFSDNTLLPSGNRFGLYIRTVDEIPGVVRVMNVWFVWFPREFVPPRERPFDLDVEVAGGSPAGQGGDVN